MDVRVGRWRKLSTEELMLLNYGVEDLECKKIQPVHPEGDQSWVFIGKTDVEAETPILWPPHTKSWLIGKDPNAGKDWEQDKKGTTEDEMAGWHHRLDGHGFGKLQELVMDRRPGVLQSMGSQRVGYNWVTELNWTLILVSASAFYLLSYVVLV